jgi:hypothetical protein
MASRVHEFWLPRRGSSSEEYEDAFARDAAAGRFALADGATESSFSALWAQLLVNDFVQNAAGDLDDWKKHLPGLQAQWYASVHRPSLAWNVEAKLEQGAFATFLGVVVKYAGSIPQWDAAAVGDTCLFHTRGTELFSAFPVDRSDKFNNSPRLIGSRTSPEALWKNSLPCIQASGLSGDRLWLMTDALAQWCLLEHEKHDGPWPRLDAMLHEPEPDRALGAWIDELRSSRQMRNDDVTLLAIEL